MRESYPAAVRWLLLACLILAAGGSVGSGCAASYAAPGGAARWSDVGFEQKQLMTPDSDVRATFDRRPAASFPTALCVVRVQAAGYTSKTGRGYGEGRYSVITQRDVESDEAVARLNALPQVSGVAAVNRLLLPQSLTSDSELRQAAAALGCDVMLLYTLDTSFESDEQAKPLAVVTLGLSPTKVARVTTTASALAVDTRTGFVYAVAEATAEDDQLANSWTSESAIDQTRRRVEQAAFDKLVGEVETAWAGVVANHAGGSAADTN